MDDRPSEFNECVEERWNECRIERLERSCCACTAMMERNRRTGNEKMYLYRDQYEPEHVARFLAIARCRGRVRREGRKKAMQRYRNHPLHQHEGWIA